MFTQIPADLSGLSLTELKDLLKTSRDEIRSALSAGEIKTKEDLAAVKELREVGHVQLEEAIAAAELAAPVSDEDLQDLADSLGENDEPSTEAASDEEAPAADSTPTAGNPALSEVDEGAAPASGSQRPYSGFVGTAVTGFGGSRLENPVDLARALIDAATSNQLSNSKIPVAVAKAVFDEGARHIDGDSSEALAANFNRFAGDEMAAALCAPAPPSYEMDCFSSTARPVYGSLVKREAPRGQEQTYPSPTLSDITDNAQGNAVGIWTSVDDVTPASAKGYTTITCGTPVTYEVYGVYRAIRVKELLLRTFPELVAAYLNKLEALWARTAEIQLMAAMFAGTTSIDHMDVTSGSEGYGANVAVMRRLETLLARHRDQERWDDIGPLNVYVPRWFVSALKIDKGSRSGASWPTTADITRQFADMGATLVPVMDRPSWQVADGALSTAGDLNSLPTDVNMLVTPADKFACMERGDLTAGVRGAPMRDTAMVSTNESQIFYEAFEGIVDTNTCPAYTLNFNGLRYSGHQIREVELTAAGQIPA